MKRILEPELLDGLAPNDPAAVRSRRDLVRINAVMLQPAIMARALRSYPPPRRVLDLGGGDGRFLLSVAQRLNWTDVSAIIVDRQHILDGSTCKEFESLGWRCTVQQADVTFALSGLDRSTLVIANLFLHHLDEQALVRLFAVAEAAGGLVACEPRRNGPALAASHMVFALGCNAVTRHDAVVSVRAGFSGQELSALWPTSEDWELREYRALPFTHLFMARRAV